MRDRFRGALALRLALGASFAVAGCDATEAPTDRQPTSTGAAPTAGVPAELRAHAQQAAKMIATVAANEDARTEFQSLVRATAGEHDEAITFDVLLHPEKDRTTTARRGLASVANRGAFASAFKAATSDGTAARGAGDPTPDAALAQYLIDNDLQLFWPNPEDWDGVTAPVVTFDPMTDALENVAYRVRSGAARGGDAGDSLMVNEAYSDANPVWVVNVSEAPPDGVMQMLPPPDGDPGDGGGGGGGGGSGGGSTCPGPPPVEPQNAVSLILMGEMQITKQYDSWFNGGSEIYVSHPLTGLNFTNPGASTVEVSTFEVHFHRDTIDREDWKLINQEYISNWRPEIRNQKLAVHEHDPHGSITFAGKVGLSIPIPGTGSPPIPGMPGTGTPPIVATPEISFSVPFKSNDPIIYQTDHDRASYFLLNRRDIGGAGTRTPDCWRVHKGGEHLSMTLPFLLEDYPG